MSDASPMASYNQFVRKLQGALKPTRDLGEEELVGVRAMLDGEATEQLRALIPLKTLRLSGAFFSGSRIASRLAGPILDELSSTSVLYDPACGAGDLLLPFVSRLTAVGADLSQATSGRDLYPEFVAAARLRLKLASLLEAGVLPSGLSFDRIRIGSGTANVAAVRRATHIVMNPPFIPVVPPPWFTWSSGRTNAAAVFLTAVLRHARPGTVVRAIVPDVLRSGSRYSKWRHHVGEIASVVSVEPYGRFDESTNVDVVLLTLQAGVSLRSATWYAVKEGVTVSDLFDLNVGAVVNYRDPHDGATRAYLTGRDLPRYGVVQRIDRRRQFVGALCSPPFVAISRTSSPRDLFRARAALVTGSRSVAVDNHIVAARPRRGGVKACEALMRVLQSEQTNEWLNSRIRCRHLTVGAIGGIPWHGPLPSRLVNARLAP